MIRNPWLKALPLFILLFAGLGRDAFAADYSWANQDETVLDASGKATTWQQVEFVVPADKSSKHREQSFVLATRKEWITSASKGKPGFEPTLGINDFDISVPLYALSNPKTVATDKTVVTTFDAELTDYRLYVRFANTTLANKTPGSSIKLNSSTDDFKAKDKPAFEVQVLCENVGGMEKDGTQKKDEKRQVLVHVNLPAAQPPKEGPQPSTLSRFELAAMKAWTPGVQDRAKLVEALKRYYGAYNNSSDEFTASEITYLQERLAGQFQKFDAWRKIAQGQDDKGKKAFIARWRNKILTEVADYISYGAAGNLDDKARYDPDKHLRNQSLTHMVDAQSDAPASPMDQALYKRLPDDTTPGADNRRVQAMRKILKAAYGEQADPEKFLGNHDAAFWQKQAAAFALGGLRKQSWNPASANVLSGIQDDSIFKAAYCGTRRSDADFILPAAGAKSDGKVAMSQLKAEAKGDVNKVTDNSAAVVVTSSERESRCADYWNSIKAHDALSDSNPQGSYRDGKVPDFKASADKVDDKGKPADDDKNNIINGIKFGVWAAIIGGILAGPAGLLLLGVVGFAAGYLISKES